MFIHSPVVVRICFDMYCYEFVNAVNIMCMYIEIYHNFWASRVVLK
jgi:hypothetical protein